MSYTETEVNKIEEQYFSSGWDAGIQHERERIIKLLMTAGIELRYWDGEKAHDISHWSHTAEEAEAELRALIEGEK